MPLILVKKTITTGGVTNHEALSNLLGGDKTGHYHFTKEQYDKLLALLEERPIETVTIYDGMFAYTPDAEYSHVLDNGSPVSRITDVTDCGGV